MFPQKRRARVLAAAAATTVLALTAACSGGGGGDGQANDDGEPAGSITVLTWRTDLVQDGTFDEYVEQFKAAYPEVTEVKVEGITDYEGEVKTRMKIDTSVTRTTAEKAMPKAAKPAEAAGKPDGGK